MVRTKVIIDTDAGIDDALAIFMALGGHKRDELEVIAITTVQGNTEVHNVNKNVQRILHTANLMQIPVYGGAYRPLVKPWDYSKQTYHGIDGFGDVSLPPCNAAPLQSQHAVWALINLVNKYPNEIVVAALGPLTNLALAINLDPSFTSNLLGIYVMGGNTTGMGNVTSSAEFNFLCDPEAAKVVLNETTIPIHLTHWEATLCPGALSYSLRHEFGQIKSPNAELMNKIETKIIDRKELDDWVSCDCLAMAWMIDDIKCGKLQKGISCSDMNGDVTCLVTSFKSCYASVELNGELTRGQMVIDHLQQVKKKPNIIYITDINKSRYIQYLRMAFGGEF